MPKNRDIKKPVVSIIIVTYNEEKNLEKCLQAIHAQSFPQSNYEIIVVDDFSTDKTGEIAKKYGAKVIESGFKHIERSKAIGIHNSIGKYIFFIDADIQLIETDILALSVRSLEETTAFGVQIIHWEYTKDHSVYDRYCELFGINNPIPYMLGKRGVLSPYEKEWMDTSAVITDGKDYSLLTLSLKNLRTFGSQGFMIRRSSLQKATAKNYFFHLDVVSELVSKGTNEIIILKRHIRHSYVTSFYEFHKKLYRNIALYYQYKKYRTYSYDIASLKFPFVLLAMITVIVPLYQSMRGYIKIPDAAWFLHPIFCITVPLMYAYASIVFSFRYED